MIEITNLTKTFERGKVTALTDVSCELQSGKLIGFIGPDGSGKTTLIRIIAGILTPDSGEIVVDGQPLDIYETRDKEKLQIGDYQRVTSYMPQKFGLYEDLSVIENLTLYAQLRGLSGDEMHKAFEKVLDLVKLGNFQDRLAGNLSGGMKQKLGLACSLLRKPKILILDEPSVGVDPISRKDLIRMVNTMLDNHTTVLWSTAYLDEAEDLDHVVLLHDGKVTYEGCPHNAKQTVNGRVFLFGGVTEKKRLFSSELLRTDGIIDSVIVGKNIKVITRDRSIEEIYQEVSLRHEDLKKPTPLVPIFEDACIDILGGIQEKESPVTEYVKDLSFSGHDTVVEAMGLTKKFGNFTAAENISFSVKRGKIFGLLGPNGSGKSTTFKMLCGLLRQNAGTAKIVGIDISNMGSDAKLNIGYMAQKFSLYPVLSVRHNLEFASGAYRLSGKRRRDAVNKMIEIFHLGSLQNSNAGSLSLGFKQRLALACAIIHKPPVLFLDEPTSGVDPITRKEFWMHINAMVMCGVSTIVTTHFMDEAENCDEIALIYNGKIRAHGTPDELKSLCKEEKNPTLNHVFVKIVKEVDAAMEEQGQ
ncbi:MAG: ATP-binding cassette domain-containing protein [Holosporales bacterium]|jgi:ABC-type multidrug transport system ATPase subunit|nr:ATP-binding cassette domain-containing protein [Holosporales bacterium]